MTIQEIPLHELNPRLFIEDKCRRISDQVGDGKAVNALSGGVDSSVTTLLAHRALGERLLTFFIDNGLMREGEPEAVVAAMKELGVPVTLVDAGVRDGKRAWGRQIEIRCSESKDAVTATPTRLDFDLLCQMADRITSEVPGVVSVTYNVTSKPPSTIEAV